MDKQEQLTTLLNQDITWDRKVSPYFNFPPPWSNHESLNPQLRPTIEELGIELSKVAEIRALRLGAWLTSPDGEPITQAVEAMTPPLYRPDVELLIAGLKFAAEMQQQNGRDQFWLTTASVAGALAIGISRVASKTAA